jgi:hypothetical protein
LPSWSEGFALVFLDRPVLRPVPILCKRLADACLVMQLKMAGATHLSADDAMRFAMSEYLQVDCRLIQAKQ